MSDETEVLVLSGKDLNEFKTWINLDIESISWEGRKLKEFSACWDAIFLEDSDLNSYFERLSIAKKYSKHGPVLRWFAWIEELLMAYLFIFKQLSIGELSRLTNCSPNKTSLILRDYFIERFPHHYEKLNDHFQLGTLISKNMHLRFEEMEHLDEMREVINSESGQEKNDQLLAELEVTLYPDWQEVYDKVANFNNKRMGRGHKEFSRKRFGGQIRFFRELTLLFILGGGILFAVKEINHYYEDHLVNKISLFEPNFFWLDTSLSFQSKDPLDRKEVELSYKELENLEKTEAIRNFENINDERIRFEGESDVILTSAEFLPKDFTVVDLEQSEYEENRKGGYRNIRYGRRKAYRIMMTTINPDKTKQQLAKILSYFDVKQADNVRPGTSIPGGIYFNLFVPNTELQEFISRVSEVGDATILESNTIFKVPSGTNKVFIWIKTI